MPIAFDFDGTLVDSYTIIPIIYKKFKEEFSLSEGFVDSMLMLEDVWDFFGISERKRWIELLFKDEKIWEEYWEIRKENQFVLPETIEFLEKIRKKEKVFLVTEKDDIAEIKKERIEKSGLKKYFDDIIIYGENDFKNIKEAIDYLKNNYENIVYVDDKNTNLYKLLNSNIKLIKRIYYPPFPLKLAWKFPEINVIKIFSLKELEKYI